MSKITSEVAKQVSKSKFADGMLAHYKERLGVRPFIDFNSSGMKVFSNICGLSGGFFVGAVMALEGRDRGRDRGRKLYDDFPRQFSTSLFFGVTGGVLGFTFFGGASKVISAFAPEILVGSFAYGGYTVAKDTISNGFQIGDNKNNMLPDPNVPVKIYDVNIESLRNQQIDMEY